MMSAKETLQELIGQYWDCAYKEGADGRDVDINGDAGAILHAIDLEIAAIRHARDAEVDDLNEAILALEAKLSALAPHTCGCSYDRTGDLCDHHSPRVGALKARVAELETELSEIKGQRRVWMDTDSIAEVLRDQEIELVACQTRAAELERLIKAVRPAVARRLDFVQWRIDAAKALGEK